MENFIFLIVIVILQGCVFGAFTQRVACEKGYSDRWFWAGFWFGEIALMAACGLPDRQEEGRQREATKKARRAESLAQREKEKERYEAGYS